MRQLPGELEALLEIARDLTASLAGTDRYARLLEAVTRAIPCDAACLLRLQGDDLVPVAARGLVEEALVRRFPRRDHPRLDLILQSAEPVRFATDSPLADPFDGLLQADARALERVHACLGCRLMEGAQVVGALTADALDPHAFDRLDPWVLVTLGALAGAAMRTTGLIEALERTAERRGQVARELQRSAGLSSGGQFLGASAATRRLLDEIHLVARSDLAVLITGETGVGKELVARQIHDASPRRDEALIQVNCAALPESIAESELFGHVAGAFTGATRDRAGKFEIADGGTLFLDEIGELPLGLQPKLLRAIEQGEIQRVGSDRALRVDVRILAATNRNLEAEVAAGSLPRRPLPSAGGLSHPGPAAARTAPGHPAPCRTFPRPRPAAPWARTGPFDRRRPRAAWSAPIGPETCGSSRMSSAAACCAPHASSPNARAPC